MKTRLIVIDTETGGLDPRRHALLTIAAFDSQTGDSWEARIKPAPGLEIDQEALAVNGLDVADLARSGREERDAMMDLWCWARLRKDGILAGCSPEFDAGFLKAACDRAKVSWPFTHRTLDLRAAAWCAYEAGILPLPLSKAGRPRFDLDAILGALGLSRAADKHDATEDAELTLAAFEGITHLLGGNK